MGRRKRSHYNKTKLINDIQIEKVDTRTIYDEATANHDDLIYNQRDVYRWMVNVVRHNHTNYDTTLNKTYHNTKQYKQYKNAVLSKISIAYPNLKDECNNQSNTVKMIRIVKEDDSHDLLSK